MLFAEEVPAYRVKRGDKFGQMVKNDEGKNEFLCSATVVKTITTDGGIVLETDAGWNAEMKRSEKFTIWRVKK